MKFDAQTKISKLLNADEGMLDFIMQIHPKFSKLSNPLLRKALAPRVTIADAAKIAGINVNDFLKKLEEKGFDVTYSPEKEEKEYVTTCDLTRKYKPVRIDARKLLEQNTDPFDTIRQALNNLKENEALEVILDFIPVPLIEIFKKQGYQHCVLLKDGIYHTYFYKEITPKNFWQKIKSFFGSKKNQSKDLSGTTPEEDIEKILKDYKDNMVTIDVRDLEMPQPMMKILETLKNLPEGKALFVEHKRIPQFLLPELEKQGYDWATKKLSEDHTQMIIYKK